MVRIKKGYVRAVYTLKGTGGGGGGGGEDEEREEKRSRELDEWDW